MRRAALLLVTAMLAFSAGLAWRWPARSLAPWLPAGVTCARLGGTVWNGYCTELTSSGRPLGHLQWQLQPSRLLLGRLAGQLRLVTPGGAVSGTVALGIGGSVEARDIEAQLDLARTGLPGLPPDLGGRIVADLDLLRWAAGSLATVAGRLEVNGLVRGAPAFQLGSYELLFEPQPTGATPVARVQDLGGPLWVRATLTWMAPAGYLLEGEVQPRDSASAELRRQLDLLGPGDANGRRTFAQEASL